MNSKNIRVHFVFILFAFLVSKSANAEQVQQLDMDNWLKARFSTQHEKLIPIVAVADMYFSCQQQKQVDDKVTIKALITQVDKNDLAVKLIECLDGENPKSDTALNYGLTACFHEQFLNLSETEKKQKMTLVAKTIATLSRQERQKSFTKCVTDQAISYLI